MAFQTNVLRGGEWVTETVDLQTVLKANANAKGPKRPRQLKPPQCGILTKTVLESQLVNTILFARLRSPRRNDVVFVRNTSIQLLELQEDSRLVEIATVKDFGSRIRNACVVGSFELDSIYGSDQEEGLPKFGFSSPPGSLETTPQSPPQLPPQLLFLVLENGDSLFLFHPEASAGFAMVRYPSPMPQLAYLGFHLAIDPSSRYMVLASHQEHLIIQEIKSHDDLNQDYINNKALHPIRRYQPRSIQGVIHKVAFLHPRPQDVHHIILLLIVVKNGRSRMVTYEWELGDDLGAVFAEEKHGYPMEVQNRLPLMVIPLTVQSAFMTICSDDVITIWTGGLHGPPIALPPVDFKDKSDPTKTHSGKSAPLWTTWARPLRIRPYFERQDSIYLAREDGVVRWIDIDEDAEILRSVQMKMEFDGNISSAVACGYHDFADALFIGADSGPGGIWKVPARRELQLLSTLPTTAPTMDFVTTYQPSESDSREVQLQSPDRVFTAAGCGTKGSLAEYRYGLKAEIDLEFEYGPGVKNVWMFPCLYNGRSEGAHLILSLPDTSAAIQFSKHFDDASDLDQSDVPYELSSTTLALEYTDSVLVQITQRSVTLVAQGRSARYPFATILEQYPNATISNACILNGCIACSLYFDSRHLIVTLTIDLGRFSPVFQQEFEVNGEVNGLAMADKFVAAGVWTDGKPLLVTCIRGSLEPPKIHDLVALLGPPDGSGVGVPGERAARVIEPIASIACLNDCVLLGTRSGEVMTVANNVDGGLTINLQKFGVSTANISCNRGSQTPGGEPTVLVCCDGNMVLLQPNSSNSARPEPYLRQLWAKFSDIQVFPVDEQNPVVPPPPVDVGVVVNLPSDGPGFRQILMVSESKLLLARLDQKPGPVHRQIPTAGAPTRVIYSPRLRCIIAAVNTGKESKPTLSFIDPDSGEEIGHPTDKTENPVEFISGLGKAGDTVYGLEEWKFKKDGNVWEYILVSTRGGRLIVVDTKEDTTQEDGPRSIRYWARFTHKEPESPIYSVLGCEEGLIYCAGTTIYWYVLDLDAKKLKPLKSFNLSCPATSLQIANGKLMALTSRDSLLVLDHSMDSSGAGLCHADPKPRNATHMIEVELDEPMGSITLVADRDCGVGGLWIPWQSPQKDCEPVFEVQLDASIRRFRRGRTRPLWDHPFQVPMYGRLMSTADDAEMLGVSLDGSLRHFTLLGLDTWRLLRFIQNLSHDACVLAPVRVTNMAELDPEPKIDKGFAMQVDGDILATCLEKRHLERLLGRPEHAKRFVELLDELEGGKYTSQLPSGTNKLLFYVLLAYDIMEYFLRDPL